MATIKRLLAFACVTALLFCMTACTGEKEGDSNGGNSPTTTKNNSATGANAEFFAADGQSFKSEEDAATYFAKNCENVIKITNLKYLGDSPKTGEYKNVKGEEGLMFGTATVTEVLKGDAYKADDEATIEVSVLFAGNEGFINGTELVEENSYYVFFNKTETKSVEIGGEARDVTYVTPHFNLIYGIFISQATSFVEPANEFGGQIFVPIKIADFLEAVESGIK